MQTSATNTYSEPAWGLIGDPTTALGADLTQLGLLPNFEVQPLFNHQGSGNEGGHELHDSQLGFCVGANVSLTLHSNQAAILAKFFTEITDQTGATGYSTVPTIIQAPTLIGIPIGSKGNGITDAKIQVVPSFRADDLSAFMRKFNAGAGATVNSNPITISGKALLRASDQASQALQEWAQVYFEGDCDIALGGSPTTSWSFPTGY